MLTTDRDGTITVRAFQAADEMIVWSGPAPEGAWRQTGESQISDLAFDRATTRTTDRDGHLHVAESNISKATVNPYLGREIPDWQQLGLVADNTYQLLRDPAELEKAADTFNGKPLLIKHKPVDAYDHATDLVVGAISNPVFQHPFLKAELVIWPGEAIDAVEDGSQRELSCGYRYRADMTPGSYEGKNYDGVMRDIFGNHVALVSAGRAGSDVCVGDSEDEILWDLIEKALVSFDA